MWFTQKTDISQSRMDVEYYIPKHFWGSKGNYQRGCMHEILLWNKTIIHRNRCIWVGLEAALLQTRDSMSCHRDEVPDSSIPRLTAFTSNNLTGEKKKYSNNEREILGILYGLEKFHHYCFGREVSIIMDHKPPVSIFKKDVTTSSQRLQWILLRIHQYRVRIIYKPGLTLFMAD